MRYACSAAIVLCGLAWGVDVAHVVRALKYGVTTQPFVPGAARMQALARLLRG